MKPKALVSGLMALMLIQGSALAVTVETVQSIVYDESIPLGGIVTPLREVTLRAQVPGRVVLVSGLEGDEFAAGDLLAKIDDTALLAKRNQVLAELNAARTALSNAQVQYTRELWSPSRDSVSNAPGMGIPSMFDKMFTRNFADMAGMEDTTMQKRADLYQQSAGVGQAQSRLQAVESQLNEIDTKIAEAQSTAPFDGILVEKSVEAGDTVQPGQVMLKFVKKAALSIEVNVPVRLMSSIKKGDIFKSRLDNGHVTNCRVSQVYPVANMTQHTVKVKFDLPVNTPAGPGMYAEVQLPNPEAIRRNAVLIAKSSIIRRGSMPAVYVVNDKGLTEMRAVRLGRQIDPAHLLVMSGLRLGDRLIVDPPANISSGLVFDQGRLLSQAEQPAQ